MTFGVDIAGLVIASTNDCNLSLKDGKSQWFIFGVDEYLYIWCLLHMSGYVVICCLGMPSCIGCYPEVCCHITIASWICLMLCFIPWNIIGAMLYSEMNR